VVSPVPQGCVPVYRAVCLREFFWGQIFSRGSLGCAPVPQGCVPAYRILLLLSNKLFSTLGIFGVAGPTTGMSPPGGHNILQFHGATPRHICEILRLHC